MVFLGRPEGYAGKSGTRDSQQILPYRLSLELTSVRHIYWLGWRASASSVRRHGRSPADSVVLSGRRPPSTIAVRATAARAN